MTREPRSYVEPQVNEARVERVWQGLAERLEARPAHGLRWLLLCGALAGAAAAGTLWLRTEPSAATAVNRAERRVIGDESLATQQAGLAFGLADGSSIELAAQSQLAVRGNQSSQVSLLLREGAVECDVTHREGRSFKVLAGDVEVRVVGTKFSVKRSSGPTPRVEVNVERGVVEIVSQRRPDAVARVGAGQSWIQSAAGPAESASATEAPSAAQPPAASAAQLALPASGQGSGAASARPHKPPASRLLEDANELRRSGDIAGAARTYQDLIGLYPSDSRSGLAAFELGRLRMDRLRDLPGAIAMFELSVKMSGSGTFREDAMARLVSAYAARGSFDACRRARDRYLATFPAGVHASAVATRCGSR